MKYLGEFEVNLKDTPYAKYQKIDWIMEYIQRYGQIDGSHHKQWVLDQIARIRFDTPVDVKLAKWSNGNEEYRIELGEPSQSYLAWVEEMKGEWNEEEGYFEYGYDEGCAP